MIVKKIVYLVFLLLCYTGISQAQNNETCTFFTPPFYEGFESNSTTVNCWQVIDLDPPGTVSNLTWNLQSTWPALMGGQSAKLQTYWNTASHEDWLISPGILLDGNQRLRFSYQRGGSYYSSHFEVRLSTTTDNPTDFTEVIMPDQAMLATSPEEVIINLTGYTGVVYIAFYVPVNTLLTPEGNGWDINIDDFFVEDIPTCPNPTELVLDSITDTSSLLSWQAGYQETQWQVAIVGREEDETDIDESTIVLVDQPSFLAEGLTASTGYKFYVRAYCQTDDQSQWIPSSSFFTKGCAEENSCKYKAVFYATSSGGGYGSLLQVTQSEVVIHSLNPNTQITTLEFSVCNDLETIFTWSNTYWNSYFTAIYIFDPYQEIVYEYHQGDDIQVPFFSIDELRCESVVTCFIPQNFEVSQIEQTSVQLSWDEMGTASSWEIVILDQEDQTPDTPARRLQTNTNPVIIDGLESGKPYSFYVRSICSESDTSNWSFKLDAHTIIANDECATAHVLPVSEDGYCQHPYRATLVTATQSDNPVNPCGNAVANDDIWFQFTATSDKHILFINNVKGVSTNLFINDYSLNKVLYSGSCGTLTEIQCFAGNRAPLNSQQNVNQANIDNDVLLENLVVGQVYTLRVYSNFLEQTKVSFDICIATPEKSILVSDTKYSVEELISEVLMGSTCGQISNIQSSTGINFGASHNGIGYFERGDSNFAFENGIVLSTGKATNAMGNKLSIQSANYSQQNGEDLWEGDEDLLNYIQGLGIDPELERYYNASVLEFDFVSDNDFMSFDFIFSSEDYGRFQCQWADAFAFFLTDSNGNTKNLAFVPDTQIPISIATIRDARYNYIGSTDSCSSENESFFDHLTDGYKGISRYAGMNNFYGNTIPMTASSDIIPGERYHIKLVISDRNDGNYDSAVFIKGGSFNFDTHVEMGPDLLVENETALCMGDVIRIHSQFTDREFTYSWYRDQEELIGEHEPYLEVTQTGNYLLKITFPNSSCEIEGEQRVEFYRDFIPQVNETENYTFCFEEEHRLDLTQQETDLIEQITDYTFSFDYFTSLENAKHNTGRIENPKSFTFSTNTTIYIRLTSDKGCSFITSFMITINPAVSVIQLEDVVSCSSFVLPLIPDDQHFFLEENGQGQELFPGHRLEQGEYTIYLYQRKEYCYAESSFKVTIKNCEIPKGISPNGDGLNDALVLEDFSILSVKIYNRLGIEVFSYGNKYTNQWHGQDKSNKDLPSGTYFYEIITTDDTRTGWIQLMR